MQVYKTKQFARFANKENISDDSLCEAIGRAQKGNIDKKLRDDIIVQRVAREGQGKRKGYRTVILFKQGNKAFFVNGYERKKQDGIDERTLRGYRRLATKLLTLNQKEMEKEIKNGQIIEVKQNDQKIP